MNLIVREKRRKEMSEAQLEIIKAHRNRLWKAMGEIESRMKSHEKQLSGMYKQNLWIPVKERRETDPRARPNYFDGLADWIEFLRPILMGVK